MGVPGGTFRVVVEADGYEVAAAGPLDPAALPELVAVRLRALPGVRGVVLADAQPVAGADGRARTVRLGGDGRFSFAALAPGPWEVREVEEEISPLESSTWSTMGEAEFQWNCTVAEGLATWVELGAAAPPAVLEGVLRVDGEPARAWTAALLPVGQEGPFAVEGEPLDAAGRFRVEAPGAGAWILRLTPPAEAEMAAVVLEEVQLPPGPSAWEADLATGTLVLEGLETGRLWLACSVTDVGRVVVTPVQAGADGRARLRVPAGSLRLLHGPLDSLEDARLAPAAEVEVPAGGEARLDLRGL